MLYGRCVDQGGAANALSREKASELTGLANDAADEVLDPDHFEDHSPEPNAELVSLYLPISEFHNRTEDELIFIAHGENPAEGIAAEGPPCLSATANFCCRWYNDVILKQRPVLLSDERRHYLNERSEK
jgi:hypothetical protein